MHDVGKEGKRLIYMQYIKRRNRMEGKSTDASGGQEKIQ